MKIGLAARLSFIITLRKWTIPNYRCNHVVCCKKVSVKVNNLLEAHCAVAGSYHRNRSYTSGLPLLLNFSRQHNLEYICYLSAARQKHKTQYEMNWTIVCKFPLRQVKEFKRKLHWITATVLCSTYHKHCIYLFCGLIIIEFGLVIDK